MSQKHHLPGTIALKMTKNSLFSLTESSWEAYADKSDIFQRSHYLKRNQCHGERQLAIKKMAWLSSGAICGDCVFVGF